MENNRKKIIMVDDDLVILKIGKQFLKDKYDVFPVPSAEKLFDILEKVTPDVILLDVYMPDMDGIDIIKRLKTDKNYANIPVIFVSSADDEQRVSEYLKLGACSNLAKPFDAKEINSCIENCLSNQTSQAQPGSNKASEDDKKIIVAVDDAPDILRVLHSLLSKTYKVYTVSDPEQLKPLLETITPDLFLLDYIMPGLTGTALIPIIRKFPENKDTPIIFLTSERSPGFLKEAVKLGARDFMIKPIDEKVLHEKIALHI